MSAESVPDRFEDLSQHFPLERIGSRGAIVNADCFDVFQRLPEASIHAVVTDPPYGVKEYNDDQIEKKDAGKGGIWRIPPSFDGNVRAPLPRFTALNAKERATVVDFFTEWSRKMVPALRPGAHVFVAGNAFLSQLVFSAIVEGGLEFRGEIIRIVRTLRGGDRPKGAEEEFPDAVSLPRGCYEPWGLFRKAMPPRMTVGACLREYQTGALRRLPDGRPFSDVLPSERTPRQERDLADHPSIKPQSLMRQLVHASLPLGEGVVLEPFMGSGSTIAAAEAIGYASLGVERSAEYYALAKAAIPKLKRVSPGIIFHEPEEAQLSML